MKGKKMEKYRISVFKNEIDMAKNSPWYIEAHTNDINAAMAFKPGIANGFVVIEIDNGTGYEPYMYSRVMTETKQTPFVEI